MTLPKGQMIPTQSQAEKSPLVPGGGHVLIIPITHYPTYSTIPSDLAPPILQETDSYKTAFRAFYAKHQSAAVFFEIGKITAKGSHAHLHCVPIPLQLKDKVRDAYVEEGRGLGIDFVEGEDEVNEALDSVGGGRGGYFKVELPDGKKIVHVMKEGVPFSLMFGRYIFFLFSLDVTLIVLLGKYW